MKLQPQPSVLAWMRERNDADLFVSAMTIAKLKRGVVKMTPSRRKLELSVWLEKLQMGFGERVLPFTCETAAYWAEMCARAESVGKTMTAFDSIIAATALEHGLALVTRNVSDFNNAPVVLLAPWAEGLLTMCDSKT